MKTGTEKQANLSLAKKIIPPIQYRLTLGLARGEEGEFFMRKIVDAARTAERLYAMHGENLNADGLTVERAVGERLASNPYFSYCAENETD